MRRPSAPGADSPNEVSNTAGAPGTRVTPSKGTGAPAGTTFESRVIIIGAAQDLHRAVTHPTVEGWRFEVVGTFPVSIEEGISDAAATDVERLLASGWADAVFLAGPVGPSIAAWIRDVALAHGRAVWAVMPTEIPGGAMPRVLWSGSAPILEIVGERRSAFTRAVKRGTDVAGALLGLVVAAPIVAVLAVLVRLESPGAAFFSHLRMGRGGLPFGCLKLRTMAADAEAQLQADEALFGAYRRNNFKIPDEHDPRVTRLGRLLRRASLDELPQLWNVLRGDMSLVGPRPVVPAELEHFAGSEDLLLSVRPGITGAWAVNGRHHVGYPRRAELELDYVRSWSLRGDFTILARTVLAVLDPSGSAEQE